jgi:hypothetical protein
MLGSDRDPTMPRVISAACLAAGALLIATKLASPAGSSPAPQALGDSPHDQLPRELISINQDVERLRQRVPPAPALAPPVRDPFDFRRVSRRPVTGARDVTGAADAPVVVPTLPRLVAILQAADAAGSPAAVLTRGEGVEIYKVGDRAGDLRVTAITADTVVLAADGLQQTFTLSLH